MERPTDDLLRRILAAASNEAGGRDLRRLVAEARAEAEDEVKGLLKSAIKAALLRAAADQLEAVPSLLNPIDLRNPASASSNGSGTSAPVPEDILPETETYAEAESTDEEAGSRAACYLYAITAARPESWSPSVSGVDATRPSELVRHGDLQAVVSQVSLEEFGQAGLDERATDPQWIEEKVRAHDQVIKSAMAAGGAVIPCRFCTVLRGTQDVRRLLDAHRPHLLTTLAALEGKQEWGVKVYARAPSEVARELAESIADGTDGAGAAATRAGTAYLRRRKREDELRGEVDRAARARAAACHNELAALAAAAVTLPRRSRGNGARGGPDEPVLNGAYLVPEARVEQFHAAVAEMHERYKPLGLEFEVTGPWPPYNFVRLDLSLGAVT
jgi:hypothetical protein